MSNSSATRPVVFIICAGHSVKKLDGDPLTEEGLVLLDYQKDGTHFLLFQMHIRRCLDLVRDYLQRGWQPYLVFSGGISRNESPFSEAETYLEIAERLPEWKPEYHDLVVLEPFARDSYENCLFGLAAGYSASQSIPAEVVMVSFAFKSQRFGYHAAAMGLVPEGTNNLAPEDVPKFRFVGVGNPPGLGGALIGEANAVKLFLFDPHGLSAECNLKRTERNPLNRQHNYSEGAVGWPLIASLLVLNKSLSSTSRS